MRLLNEEEIMRLKWMSRDNSKWHSYTEDGDIIFDKDTPQEIIDSYMKWEEWKTSRNMSNR